MLAESASYGSAMTGSAVFFDVDGVLIDSLEIKGSAFADLFADEQAERNAERDGVEQVGRRKSGETDAGVRKRKERQDAVGNPRMERMFDFPERGPACL